MSDWARIWKRAAKRLRAKSAERLAIIDELVSAIGGSDFYGHASVSPELWARIQRAREE